MKDPSATEKLDFESTSSSWVVAASSIHGKGLFARILISAGDVIGTIEGEYTTTDGDYVLWLDEDTGIRVQSDLRYINHSDTPNAAYYEDLVVVALKDIQPGEEITHDYNQPGLAGDEIETEGGGLPYQQPWLPWLLLLLSWLGMVVYLLRDYWRD